jgi:DNA-binding response OmpR family regulator
VLHIEDDQIQRLRLAHHLADMKEFHFAITCVESEDSAVEAFRQAGADLVILDYQLSQGNGLSCLHQLRRQDATVPVVAVSGAASAEVAAKLLQAGADEYLSKHDLDADILARSVRHLLARTEALRQAGSTLESSAAARIEALFRQAYATFRASVSAEFFELLDALEVAAQQSHLTPERLHGLLETTCATLEPSTPADRPDLNPHLRPVLLEILVRLFGDARSGSEKEQG